MHTHSHYATVWAQAGREIPCFGTTHADYFHGADSRDGASGDDEIESEYEANTGDAIVRRFESLIRCACRRCSSPVTRASVGAHGGAAVETASLLETVARIAYDTVMLNHGAEPIPARCATSIFCESTARRVLRAVSIILSGTKDLCSLRGLLLGAQGSFALRAQDDDTLSRHRDVDITTEVLAELSRAPRRLPSRRSSARRGDCRSRRSEDQGVRRPDDARASRSRSTRCD